MPIAPPWETATGLALLRRAAPDAPLSLHPQAWTDAVAAAIRAAPTLPAAAVALEVPLRTLQRQLADLAERHPALAAQIPAREPGNPRLRKPSS